MLEGPVMVPRGRYNLVECDFHIPPHVGVGIFIDRQTGRGVLNEQVAHAHLELRQITGNGLGDLSGNQVTAPGGSCNGNFMLKPFGNIVGTSGGRHGVGLGRRR